MRRVKAEWQERKICTLVQKHGADGICFEELMSETLIGSSELLHYVVKLVQRGELRMREDTPDTEIVMVARG